MKILVIGSDPNLFDEKSEAFERAREYAELFDELHIVNMSSRGYSPRNFDGQLFIYPTNSAIAALRWFGAYRLGKKIAKERKIDIIDAQDPGESGLAAWLVARAAKIPLRLQIHTDIFSPWYSRAGWKEKVRYGLAKLLIPRADCIRVVSERIRRSLMSNVKCQMSNVSVLPIWTDVSKFLDPRVSASPAGIDPRISASTFKIISVGRLVDKEKNFSMLIDVMRDFVKICPKALLVIVGDGPDGERYKLQVTSYKLENNVIIESRREDLPSFLKSFDLFVLPSNYEGWGRVVIEAMAAGLPVVMTDVGLAGEVLNNEENGIVVSVGNREALVQATKGLYENREKMRKLAAAGLETVKNLKPRTREEYLEAYKKSLEICSDCL